GVSGNDRLELLIVGVGPLQVLAYDFDRLDLVGLHVAVESREVALFDIGVAHVIEELPEKDERYDNRQPDKYVLQISAQGSLSLPTRFRCFGSRIRWLCVGIR